MLLYVILNCLMKSQCHFLHISAEAAGQEGLQLFVDAGVPLDEGLVNKLIKEVLLEKTGKLF